jgi:hypothetical protein
MNKQFIWNIFSFVTILICLIVIVNSKSNENDLRSKIDKWKTIAESEREVPDLNDQAKQFLKDLNKGKSKKYLTGDALKGYKKAKENEGHEHDEEELDTSGQSVNILYATTEKTDIDKAKSVILYKLTYKSPFDEKGKGVIDQRILTMSIEIDWIKEDKTYKVNDYNVQLLKDNLDEYLSSLGKKDEKND